ncbi:glycosyltransferase [Sphingobium boeckii]|uniref:Uncharacterized protein n=1 Tax=Sphingobium boeckii TaxID=1082345 RepID=A0A7W9AJ81_9SPHN|nr:hypothetical protein [Sphingobium boeckii]MBB5686650.1 hypothetical protein [Sphingobium boeckii]
MKPRILLAWESGAGRGHLVTLKTVAAALGPDFIYDAALCRMDHAAEIAPLCDLVFPAACLYYDQAGVRGPGGTRTATWGEYLGDSGFRDPAFLTRQVRWWQDVLAARSTDLLVGDYAPCALMAAYSMSIPAVIVGTGYGIPPPRLPEFPVFLPEFSHRLYDEAEMLTLINQAVVPLGVPPLDHLSDIYRRSGELVRTLDMLDPYQGQREQPLLPPVADVSRLMASDGDEIFVYFSTSELEDEAVLGAITTLGLPIRAFCPGLGPSAATRLTAAGVLLETAPVPVDLLVRRSRLIINAGQHGILCLGLAAGLPQICIPQHLEQLYHARRAEAAGVAQVATIHDRTAPILRQMIQNAYVDGRLASAARKSAEALQPQFAVRPEAVIRARLTSLLR